MIQLDLRLGAKGMSGNKTDEMLTIGEHTGRTDQIFEHFRKHDARRTGCSVSSYRH